MIRMIRMETDLQICPMEARSFAVCIVWRVVSSCTLDAPKRSWWVLVAHLSKVTNGNELSRTLNLVASDVPFGAQLFSTVLSLAVQQTRAMGPARIQQRKQLKRTVKKTK